MGNRFDFEIKTTSSKNLTAGSFKRLLNTFIIVSIIAAIGFMIILKIQQEGGGKEETVRQIALPNFLLLKRTYEQAQIEQEVKILLEQEQIDPLTDFINQHRGESNKTKYVQLIKEERDQRCEQIRTFYLNREKTAMIMTRLKKSYDYSCPQVVKDLTTAVNKTTSSKL